MQALLVKNPAAKLCPHGSGAASGSNWCDVRGFATASCTGYVGIGGDAGTTCRTGSTAFAEAFMRNAQTDDEKRSCAVVTAVMSHEGGFSPTAKSWDMFCSGGTTGAVGLFQYDFASGLNPMPAGVDEQFKQFFRGTRGPTIEGLSRFWMACNARIAGATAASMSDYNDVAIPACEAAGAPSDQKLPGDMSCRFSGASPSPTPAPTPGGGSSSSTRCGTTWEDANTHCRATCATRGDCPSNQNCYADVSDTCTPVPAPTPAPTPTPTPTPTPAPTGPETMCRNCWPGTSGPCVYTHNRQCVDYADSTTRTCPLPHLTVSCAGVVVSSRSDVRMNVLNCEADDELERAGRALERATKSASNLGDSATIRTDAIGCVSSGAGRRSLTIVTLEWNYTVVMTEDAARTAGESATSIARKIESVDADAFAAAFVQEATLEGLETQTSSDISMSSSVDIMAGDESSSDADDDNTAVVVGVVVACVVAVVAAAVAVAWFRRAGSKPSSFNGNGDGITNTGDGGVSSL